MKRKEGTDPQTILQERAAKIHILTITDRNRTLAIFSEDGKNMDDCVPTLFDMRIKKEANVSEEGCDEYPDL